MISAIRTILCLLLLSGMAWAHDPYEITSTVYLETNAINVDTEMEFTGAMLLSGVEAGSRQSLPPAEQFATRLPQLEQQAGRFFRVLAGGISLVPLETNVTLGVENHVKFHLVFPTTDRRPLEISAPGLKGLLEQGPFGTTLTVLDMVNQKVLAQSVLFNEKTVVDVGAVEPGRTDLVTNTAVQATSATKADDHVTAAAPVESEKVAPIKPPDHLISRFALMAVAAATIVLALLWRLLARSSGGRGS